MPRIARVTADLYPHHVTQRGNNHADVFFDDQDRAYYLDKLREYCELCDVQIWAYCLMTNHVHLLAVPQHASGLSRCLGRTNLSYTQHVNRKYQRSGRLWQNRFFSTIVEKESYLWAVIRYIELNPVKAMLTGDPLSYPWSSCGFNAGTRPDNLVKESAWIEEKDKSSYRQYLLQNNTAMDDQIRRSTSTGRPLGSKEFVEKLQEEMARALLPKKAGRPKKGEEWKHRRPKDTTDLLPFQ